MSRQIQFRRGTADEHKNFTGAEGEITVDLTNKTLRVHDGVTAGGTMLARADASVAADYITAWQSPTAENNYTWYRKYTSGWVEQGGVGTIGNSANALDVTYPIAMQNTEYTLLAIAKSASSTSASTPHGCHYIQKTTTGCKLIALRGNSGDWVATEMNWQISGFAQS